MTQVVPLRRLIKRREIEALLQEFSPLLTQATLAVLTVDGKSFASTKDWSQETFEKMIDWPQVHLQNVAHRPDDGEQFCLQSLHSNGQVVGVLAGYQVAVDTDEAIAWRCLHRSLEALLDQATEKRNIAQETLERYREINLLYHISETIGACLDGEEIPQLVLREANRVIEADVGLVLLPNAETDHSLAISAKFGQEQDTQALRYSAEALIDEVFQTGRPDIITPKADTPLRAILCAPLKARDWILGVVLLGKTDETTSFTASDEKLVAALASQAAIALETAWLHQQEVKRQRLEEELSLGRQIQLSLLPETYPTIPGWEFAAVYQAARQVGGDIYDFFTLPGPSQQLGLVIADVTGKGVPAALFMAFTRTIIRTESMSGQNPVAVLQQVNQAIVQDNRSKVYLSASYATLDTETGKLTFANGGHNEPLWLQARTGKSSFLTVQSCILGAFDDIHLDEGQANIAPGDCLVFCTDGVTEAMNEDGEMYGEARLQALVEAHRIASAEDMVQSIVRAVHAFVGETPQSDDFTLFVVKRQEK
ncbi:MAG: SpoIIE family protein phosphatase [Chloroflexota bacterium]